MNPDRQQLKADKLDAFERLVAEYEAQLLRYAGRLLNASDAAQDVVQESFIRLFNNWEGELEPSANLSSWLYRVAHNCAVDLMRKDTRRSMLHVRHAAETDEEVPPNRGEGFHMSEQAEQAAAALRELDIREQQLVILKVYEEKSYREISQITGLSMGNVGYILHHAMKKLAAALRKSRAI